MAKWSTMDWGAVSESELRRALRAMAAGDTEASIPVYRYLLDVASKIAPGQSRPSAPITDTLNVDIADEAIIDVVHGAHTYRPELGGAEGWLFAVARNARGRMWREGRLGNLPREIPLSSLLGGHGVDMTLTDLVDAKRGERNEEDASHVPGIIREAKDQGFLSQAECNALWLAGSSQRFGEAVAEWVFGDAAKSRAGEKRYLTILVRLEVFRAARDMLPDDMSLQLDRAIEMEFVTTQERPGLLHFLLGDPSGRAATILDTTWGMREGLRLALFGFAASVHLGRGIVSAAVERVEEDSSFAAWCVVHDWPESYGRLLKKFRSSPPKAGDADFWDRLGFRTRIDGASATPKLHTFSISDTRRLAHDLRTLAHGIRSVRDRVASHDFSDEAVRWLRECPDAPSLLDALGRRDYGLIHRDVLEGVLDAARQGEAAHMALHVACRDVPGLEDSLQNLPGEVT